MFPLTLQRALVGAVLLTGATVAPAATYKVTAWEDVYDGVCDSHCSLRDAVAAANRRSGGDLILLPSGSYDLNRNNPLDNDQLPVEEDLNDLGDLDITDKLTIRGDNMTSSIIVGRVNDRLLEVRPGVQVTLERLALQGGDSIQNGGAVENHGTLGLREVLVMNNRVEAWDDFPGDRFHNGRGGGIANYGKLTVTGSRFHSNGALGTFIDFNSGWGGAIYNKGDLLVQDSVFLDNWVTNWTDGGSGAAIYNTGKATIERSSIIDHGASELSEGGAITNEGGALLVLNSTLSGNAGSLTNGFYDETVGQSKATLTNVTITRGGCDLFTCFEAVVNGGELRIRNSIIAGNGYDGHEWDTSLNCVNVGRYYRYRTEGLLTNDDVHNCPGDIYVPLKETYTRVLSEELATDNDRVEFHPLLPGSPAIDAGLGKCLSHDQRGMPRPQDGNGDGTAVCDLGAYELTPQ